MAILSAFLVVYGPCGGPLGSQMVELGCLDTDWVGGNKKEVLDTTLLWDGFILPTLSMDKQIYGYLWCISGWFGASRVALKIIEG